jgi:TRAP-type transport system periplasmic protein
MRFLGLAAALYAALLFVTGMARAEETLIFGTSTPPNTHISLRVFHPWAEKINQEGKGIIHIDVRDGFTLSNPSNFYSRVLNDVIQIGWGSNSGVAGTFPRTEFSTLPFQAENSEQGSVAFWRLYKSGLLDPEYNDVVVLMAQIYPQSGIQLAKPPAHPPLQNLKGLRIMAISKSAAEIVSALGGSPASILLPDLYESLMRHSVDGAIMGWTAFQPFKLAEVTFYHVDTQFGAAPAMVFMAKKRYDALSPAARKIIDENSGEAASRWLGKTWDEVEREARDATKADPKHQVVTPSAATAAKWRHELAPISAAWAKNTPNGAAILAKFHEILAQVKVGE